jgi:Domain of unknown function (DUF3291)
MSKYRLAELNIAKMKEPLESPSMADFVANLERINALADQAPGFVWRLQDESGSATAMRPFGDNFIINMSMWTDVESLTSYAFKSGHVEIMRRRREWFQRMGEAYAVLWWVAKDHRPTIAEAKARLEHLRKHGATPHAFTFKQAYPAPDTHKPAQAIISDDACPTP